MQAQSYPHPSVVTCGRSSGAEGRELFDTRVRAMLDALQDIAERHGVSLAQVGFVGSVRLNFSPHGFADVRITVFLKPRAGRPGRAGG